MIPSFIKAGSVRALPIILLALALFSCRSSNELIYMKDITDHESFPALADSETEYHIKPGDILYVSIKTQDPEVNMIFNPEESSDRAGSAQHQRFTSPQGAYLYGFEVNMQGNLNLPILGLVPVVGNTQVKAEEMVQQYADEYLKDAIVKVKVLNYRVTVLGEVRNPGVYYNYDNRFTVLDAVAMANGNTDFANINRITVIRPQPDGRMAMVLDLSKKESFMARGFYLHPNDYVFVEPDKYKNFQLNSQAYSLLFSSIGMLLAVLGFVL